MADQVVRVTEHDGAEVDGRLLYLFRAPFAVSRKDGMVTHFVERIQRVGIVTQDGRSLHYTMPRGVVSVWDEGARNEWLQHLSVEGGP
jgi:hypothetical protein